MSIIHRTAKKSTLKFQIMLTMALILLAAILFALQSQPVKHVTNAVVMKRESLEITPEFEEALSVSMRRGYLQGVNWEWVA